MTAPPSNSRPTRPRRPMRFTRPEWSGAFGDIGTDLPLLAGVILASGMSPVKAFLVFGLCQWFSAWRYRLPMPVQPLKAVAALVIAQGLGEAVIAASALWIGLIMLILTAIGGLDALARWTPKPVIRGIQLGLGLKLGLLAISRYIPAEGMPGLWLAAAVAGLLVVLRRNTVFPATVGALLLGVGYALARGGLPVGLDPLPATAAAGSYWNAATLWTALVVLALPQVPLSLGNSMLATRQLAEDWFPDEGVTLRRLGATYGWLNLAVSQTGGIPVCHGSGGLAGHYACGARTGGSVIIYGGFYLALAALCAGGLNLVGALFPLPVMGVILSVEAAALCGRVRDVIRVPFDGALALLVGLLACGLDYGFLIGLVLGIALHAAARRWRAASQDYAP